MSARRPLSDTTSQIVNQADIQSSSRNTPQKSSTSKTLPHHESRGQNGNLVRNSSPNTGFPFVQKKRFGPSINGSLYNPKRLSELSSASTNTSNTPKPRKIHIGPWRLGTTLGKGATGRVRKARHVLTGQEAAVKIVSRKSALELRSKSVVHMDTVFANRAPRPDQKRIPFGIDREIIVMKVIEHPNIIKCLDVWENRGEMYLVLELVDGGELFDYIIKNGRILELEAVRIFRQILSGLAHCHRFLLCHRDIKPENILLDGNMNIKIVDFGMAAMQPQDKVLDTSCGSPHYAAPEVAMGYPYRGDKADVWSAGVVLYVMLVGTVPFGASYDISDIENGTDNLRRVLEEVIYSEIQFPDFVSDEAADLVWLMLRKDPRQRVTIDEIWSHPLLVKYEEYARHSDYAHRWIGGPPPDLTIEECSPQPKARNEVDMDVVDNLCTLWQSNDTEGIIDSILHPETNYEQLLYQRLLRARKEQEENFQGPGVGVSSSDYHHVVRCSPKPLPNRLSLISHSQHRQRSQFAISESSRRSSMRSCEPTSDTGTDDSYDPFRYSRHCFDAPEAKFAKITIHRPLPGFRNARYTSRNSFTQNKTVSRLQAHELLSSSPASNLPMDTEGNIRELRRRKAMKSYSRNSLASSNWSGASTLKFRKSVNYKRPVSFNDSRPQLKTASTMRHRAPSPLSLKQEHLPKLPDSKPRTIDSSALESTNTFLLRDVFSPEEGSQSNRVKIYPVNEPRRMSAYLKEEARQVSRELEQYCETAFREPSPKRTHVTNYGDSLASGKGKSHSRERPLGSILTESAQQLTSSSIRQRPLPEPPQKESLAFQQLRELEVAKTAVINQTSILPAGMLDEVISNMDRLITEKIRELPGIERRKRIISALEANSKGQDYLSPVKEEEYSQGLVSSIGVRSNSKFNISESTPKDCGQYRVFHNKGEAAFSVVDDDFDPVPQGLTIRKRMAVNSATNIRTHSEKPRNSVENLININKKKLGDIISSKTKPIDTLGKYSIDQRDQTHTDSAPTTPPIDCFDNFEDSNIANKRSSKLSLRDSKEFRRKGLFHRRSGESQKSRGSVEAPPPPEKDTPRQQKTFKAQGDTRTHSHTSLSPLHLLARAPVKYEESEDFVFHDGLKQTTEHTKNRLIQFFSWKDYKRKLNSNLSVVDHEDNASLAASSITSSSCAEGLRLHSKRVAVPQQVRNKVKFVEPGTQKPVRQGPQNWLARFFNVKPAKRILALHLTKSKAMKEIRGILRDWRRYGLRDIRTDRVASKISSRVDVNNSLHIKPVCISIEFFSVTQRGRKAGLCVARVTQEVGARSSFEKVYATLTRILRGRNFMIKDKKKIKQMRKCLVEWESS